MQDLHSFLRSWYCARRFFPPGTQLSLTFCLVFGTRPCILHANPEPMATVTPQTRHYWIFSADPHHYHWDTLFVKGKEMWHGAGAKPDAVRSLKQVKKGDRVLCYHSTPERSLYSIAEVTRDPYPDPHDYDGKNLVADLRAYEKLPRPVTLAEMRANPALRKVKLLKSVRRIISPLTEAEYQELLRMAGIVAMPGVPLP